MTVVKGGFGGPNPGQPTNLDQIEPHGGKLVESILPFSNQDIN